MGNTVKHLPWRIAALSMLLYGAADAAAPAARPHILLITADDLGCQLSCYGEPRLRTPRLDALAAEGVRFECFYVAQSSCSSSRAALLTGRWPHQNGQVGLAHLGFHMPAGQPNLPGLLKAAGYRTGIIGKLHVAPESYFPFDWKPPQKGTAAVATRNVRWVAEQSRAFFADAKRSGQPFFYYVNFFDPHGPYTADVNQVEGLPETPLQPEEIRELLPISAPTEAAQKRLTAVIFNTILRVDAGLGLLLDELQAAGLAENTLVLFLGDNGLPVVRGKSSSYEAGVRVPLVARWPGIVRAGQVRRELTSAVDILPTVLAAAGVASPAGLAGQSLQPLLTGEPAPWREFLFTEMNFHEPDIFKPQRTVRDARHKLLLNLAPLPGQASVELFDLQADPGETTNLAEAPAATAVRRRLEAALQQWRVATADPLLDAARLARWQQAATDWHTRKTPPPKKPGTREAIRVPPDEVERRLQ